MYNAPFSATAAGTNAGASATKAAITGHTYVVTAFSGHTDTGSILQILDGTTVVWQSAINVTVEGLSFHFSGLNVVCTLSAAAVGKIVTSTTSCQANICGYIV